MLPQQPMRMDFLLYADVYIFDKFIIACQDFRVNINPVFFSYAEILQENTIPLPYLLPLAPWFGCKTCRFYFVHMKNRQMPVFPLSFLNIVSDRISFSSFRICVQLVKGNFHMGPHQGVLHASKRLKRTSQ